MNSFTKFGTLAIILASLTACQKQASTSVSQTTTHSAISSSSTQKQSDQVSGQLAAYFEAVDADYSKEVALALGEFRTNQDLGYRTAGSEAEHQAGQYIADQMKEIGLENIQRDAFQLDGWTFDHANMSYTTSDGQEVKVELGAYQVNFDTQGPKDFDIVYLNQGTKADYEGIDVEGKLVLIDINQRVNWWINYPAYEAYFQGAAAIIAVQDGGFSEVSSDALNANDLIGPAYTPAFSMSRTDAQALLQAMESSESGMKVTFDAKSSVVEGDATSYNVWGEIPGKHPDEKIIISAHHDAYFEGFQDNSAAVGLMLGIAKAMVQSGYQPEKTIIFLSPAAEEWGAVNTRYDWSTGAYSQLFKVRPEWQDQAWFNINFEMPGIAHQATHYIQGVPELASYLEEFVGQLPDLNNPAYPEGVGVMTPSDTWADDFSFAIAGIPSVRTTMAGGDFGTQIYHSNFDTVETLNMDAFIHNHQVYGALAMWYDQTAVLPLDFSATMESFDESLDEDLLQAEGLLSAEDQALIAETKKLGEQLYQALLAKNQAYQAALAQGDQAKADELLSQSKESSQAVKAAFRLVQDRFTKLTWEDDVIFGHQVLQDNLTALVAAREALAGDRPHEEVIEALTWVDNNWYATAFSKETFNYFNAYVLDQPADRLYWGAGRIVGHVDLYDFLEDLASDQEAFNKEDALKVLDQAIADQKALLAKTWQTEMQDLASLKADLEAIQVP